MFFSYLKKKPNSITHLTTFTETHTRVSKNLNLKTGAQNYREDPEFQPRSRIQRSLNALQRNTRQNCRAHSFRALDTEADTSGEEMMPDKLPSFGTEVGGLLPAHPSHPT